MTPAVLLGGPRDTELLALKAATATIVFAIYCTDHRRWMEPCGSDEEGYWTPIDRFEYKFDRIIERDGRPLWAYVFVIPESPTLAAAVFDVMRSTK